jgi:hypothetical protein
MRRLIGVLGNRIGHGRSQDPARRPQAPHHRRLPRSSKATMVPAADGTVKGLGRITYGHTLGSNSVNVVSNPDSGDPRAQQRLLT